MTGLRSGILLLALVIVCGGAGSRAATAGTAGGLPGARAVTALLAGIPQQNTMLGNPAAPVTLVEYVDLQCVYCKLFADRTLPAIVRSYVRTGKVRLVFRGLAFLGPDSTTGLRVALAAGRQNRLWNVVSLLFANQERENSGWVTQRLLDRVAGNVPGLDPARLRRDRSGTAVTAEMASAAAAARRAGVRGTPTLEGGPSLANLRPLRLQTFAPADLAKQLDRLLKLANVA